MNRRQTIPKELRFTIFQFNQQFPDDEACLKAIAERRYPNGRAYCETCKRERKHHRVSGRTAWACDRCGNHIYPLAGTIFEKTTTKLRLWFYAMYLMASTRCGISAKQIQRETGVTYKCAWRMFKQIRSLLGETFQLEGSLIEMDETLIGGRERHSPGGMVPSKKTCVVGMVERNGRVRAVIADDNSRKTLHDIAKEYILPKSTVFTDDLVSYHGLEKYGYEHKRINHSQGVYVIGDTHTQAIEGFWSLMKNGITGVYHSVGKQYLQNYINEYSFRYNRRNRGNLIFHDVLELAAQPRVKPDLTASPKSAEEAVPF